MLESMALGVPLIASRIGGLPEAIIPGETGLLFPIGDVDALTAGMSSMIDSNMYVRRMGHAAEKLVRAAYTLERMIDGNERVLREVVATWRTTVVA
jgi:glycosyltransferase involved in cell wall biosynthesis